MAALLLDVVDHVKLAPVHPPGEEHQQEAQRLRPHKLGDVAVQAGDLPSARARFEQSHGIVQKLAQENPTSAKAQRDLSISLSQLGDVAVQAGDLPSARARFEQSLGIRQKLAQENPTSAEAQRDLSISLSKLGGVAVLTRDLPAAKARLEECVSILKKLAQRGAITPSDRQFLDQLEGILQLLP